MLNGTSPQIRTLTVALALCAAFAVSCGGGKNPDLEAKEQTKPEQVVGENKYQVLSGKDTLSQEGKSLKGVGKVIFADALINSELARNFELEVDLEVGGSFTFYSFATNDLTRGVSVFLARPAADQPLKAIVTASDDEPQDISAQLTTIDPAKRIKLLVDVHNDHGDSTHVLVWDGNKPVGADPEDSALYNDLMQDRGYGVRTGIALNKAQVYNAKTSGAIDEHK